MHPGQMNISLLSTTGREPATDGIRFGSKADCSASVSFFLHSLFR